MLVPPQRFCEPFLLPTLRRERNQQEGWKGERNGIGKREPEAAARQATDPVSIATSIK
jgi:hypothetical protein